MKIEFKKDFPPELKPRYEKIIKKASWLIPGWCQSVVVFWDAHDDERASLYTRVNYEYRFIQITVCSDCIGTSDKDLLTEVIHEMIHGFINPLADYAKEIVNTFCSKDDSPKTNKILHNEITRKNESVTQDLAFAISNKFNER